MLAIVLATGVSHLVCAGTVYTRELLRRGIDIDEPADATLRRRAATAFMVGVPERQGGSADRPGIPDRETDPRRVPQADVMGTVGTDVPGPVG